MIRSHSTKSIRIIGCKTGNYQITVSCRIVYCNFSLITNHYYIRILGQLLVNRFFVVSIACKTSPINHHTGRTFQQSYHICLRFISEFIFLEISHILIGNKMNTACIGRYGCCKFSRLFPVGSDCCRRSCYKQSVAVETKQLHTIYPFTIRVYRAGGHHRHSRYFRFEMYINITFGSFFFLKSSPLIRLAGGE